MVVTCSCVTTSTDTFVPLPLTTPEWSPKPSGRSECPSRTGAARASVTCRAVAVPQTKALPAEPLRDDTGIEEAVRTVVVSSLRPFRATKPWSPGGARADGS